MKKNIFVASMLLFSVTFFAQKKELRNAEKALKAENYMEALSNINQAEALMAGASDSDKADLAILRAKAYLESTTNKDLNKLRKAAEALMKAEELGGASNGELATTAQNLRVALVNSAIEDQNANNYANASERLYLSYMTNKKDTSDLYYAAGNAVNGKDYTTAVKYYSQLLDLGFTGIRKEFTALNTKTGETDAFQTEIERKAVLDAKTHTNPSVRNTPSLQGDILQKMVLIYISQGQNEKAVSLMSKARAANPKDTALMRAEADLAYKMNDLEKYDKLMNEIVATDPNNPEIYYNLGVGAAQIGNKEKALGYYNKALELKSDYDLAHINIAALILSDESAIVEEMNSLGNSKADNAKYDQLKEKRQNLYKDALPHLEVASKTRANNIELVRTLMNIYSQLGMDAKYKETKAKLESMDE